jgi:hypothetical protein
LNSGKGWGRSVSDLELSVRAEWKDDSEGPSQRDLGAAKFESRLFASNCISV